MPGWDRIGPIGVLAATIILALGSEPGTAQSGAGTAQARAHVYMLRGLMNIFSLGMDSFEELNKSGVYATVHNHSEWQSLADQAALDYKAGKEDPIILIGHSLGADAVTEMAAYLNRKRIPVALVVPFDGTSSFLTPANVGRLVNLTQRKYAYMRPGPVFMARSPMSMLAVIRILAISVLISRHGCMPELSVKFLPWSRDIAWLRRVARSLRQPIRRSHPMVATVLSPRKPKHRR